MAKTADNLDLLNKSQSVKFSDLIFETFSEKTPSDHESRIFELILNLSIDHGPDTPSAVKVIEVAKEGKSVSEALSAALLEINDTHGGAAEPLMALLYRLVEGKIDTAGLVKEYLEQGKRLPGFGHRIYKDEDPRAQLILKELGETEFSRVVLELEKELEQQKGQKLPLNIDGAIAVVLCSFGWQSNLGKAVFIVARTPGLVAHYLNNS